MRLIFASLALAAAMVSVTPARSQEANDKDQTLRAMRDEMARAKARLELKIPGTDQPVKPYSSNIACWIWISVK